MQGLKNNWEWILFSLAIIMVIGGFVMYGTKDGIAPESAANQPETSKTPQPKPTWSAAPAMSIDTNKQYFATLLTNKGAIKLELFAKDAPKTVNNFVFLAKQGYYDGLIFHRVIKDFMIQGGDPTGTGTGGPGYKFEDEINSNKIVAGSLAMANGGVNTNGSQFFIVTEKAQPHLDGKHTNFGKVVEGMENVKKIAAVEVSTDSLTKDRPVEPVTIDKVLIEEK